MPNEIIDPIEPVETLDILSTDEDTEKENEDEKIVTDTEAGNELEKKEPEEKVEAGTEKKEEKGEEEEELKLEGEADEDDLELVVPVRRKEILAKYPEVFKDFPYLEKAYYREQKFTEIFPTINDAKEAQEQVTAVQHHQEKLFEGNVDEILDLVKKNDPVAFGKIVDNYMPNLAKVDQSAYLHVLSNFAKQTIGSMVQEATRLKNDDLQSAAVMLNQFIFGNSDYAPPQKFSKEQPKDDSLNKERETFNQQRFETAFEETNTKATNTLKATIDSHIDPKGTMSPYVRRNAVRDCFDSLTEAIGKDQRFAVIWSKLWENAARENYSRTSVDRAKAAYLSKSKTLLPELIKRTRNEALRGQTSKSREEVKEPIARGRSTSQPSGKVEKGKIPPGMKTIDFLMQD